MNQKLIWLMLGISFSTQANSSSVEPYLHHFQNHHCAESECHISRQEIILEYISQNIGRMHPDKCEPFWFDRIQISGGANLDFGKFGNRKIGNRLPFVTLNDGYAGENTKVASINDAYLNISAHINEWTQAFVSLSFLNTSDFYSIAYTTLPDSLDIGDINNSVAMQQAFFRISNFDCTPFFFEFGQQFQDYGRYPLHPITESMTQAMTETLHTSAKVGFILDWGLNGSAAAFELPVPKTPGGTRWFDYVGAIGLAREDCGFDYSLGLGYIYNIMGINLIGNTAALREGVEPQFAVFHKVVSGFALYGDVRYDPVNISLRYTTASQPLNHLDLPKDATQPNIGAKPWAASALISYSFCFACLNQNIYFSYQISRQAVFLNLPRDRWQLGYSIYPFKNTTFTAEFDHDLAYSPAQGGPHHGNSNLISFRIGVKFG